MTSKVRKKDFMEGEYSYEKQGLIWTLFSFLGDVILLVSDFSKSTRDASHNVSEYLQFCDHDA